MSIVIYDRYQYLVAVINPVWRGASSRRLCQSARPAPKRHGWTVLQRRNISPSGTRLQQTHSRSKTSYFLRPGGTDWFRVRARFSACASFSAPTRASSSRSMEVPRRPARCKTNLIPKLDRGLATMKTLLRAAMAALSISSISPAIAGTGDMAASNTSFSSLPRVAARMPHRVTASAAAQSCATGQRCAGLCSAPLPRRARVS